MFIVNQGMLCHHQYRVLIQSEKAIFHISLIHTRWFNQVPSDLTGFITVVNGERKHLSIPLSYITYLRTDDVYTTAIREQVSKKVKYGNAMSVAKTSVQIAVKEDVTPEFIGLLTEFIMKYRRGTGLSIETIKNDISFSGTLLQDSQRFFTEDSREPLAELPEISNP